MSIPIQRSRVQWINAKAVRDLHLVISHYTQVQVYDKTLYFELERIQVFI